jgi:hypothetical protein
LVLSGHFHISTQVLLDGVIEAEKETKERVGKKRKSKGKRAVRAAEIEEDNEEEAIDVSESDVEDYIIVDVD